MILIIHDLDNKEFNKTYFSKIENSIFLDLSNIKPCLGCFKCWTKTPGICQIKDSFAENSFLLRDCSKLIVISKNFYGSYSPNIKNFFDRSISYVKPQFRIIYGEMHHKKRYDKVLDMDIYFYGDMTTLEKETIECLVEANKENFDNNYQLHFINNIKEYYYE